MTPKTQTRTDRKLKITQIRSTIGYDRSQGIVVRSMGLRRIGHSVELSDTPETRGMILKVRHIVKVEPVPSAE